MNQPRYQIVLRRDDREEFSMDALARRVGLHPVTIERFVELQLIEPVRRQGPVMSFDASALLRVRTICRLRNALGVNCAGAAVILELLDKLKVLDRENQSLRTRHSED